jgi:hypothetical protein
MQRRERLRGGCVITQAYWGPARLLATGRHNGRARCVSGHRRRLRQSRFALSGKRTRYSYLASSHSDGKPESTLAEML